MQLCKESKIVAGLCVADLISTVVFMERHGATEANAVMRFYLQYGMVAFIGAKCLLFVPALLMAEWYRQRNPRLITSTLRLVILLYVGLYGVGVYTLNRDRLVGRRFDTREFERQLNQPVSQPILFSGE
jgi:Domain of unknown function (DUF5658)